MIEKLFGKTYSFLTLFVGFGLLGLGPLWAEDDPPLDPATARPTADQMVNNLDGNWEEAIEDYKSLNKLLSQDIDAETRSYILDRIAPNVSRITDQPSYSPTHDNPSEPQTTHKISAGCAREAIQAYGYEAEGPVSVVTDNAVLNIPLTPIQICERAKSTLAATSQCVLNFMLDDPDKDHYFYELTPTIRYDMGIPQVTPAYTIGVGVDGGPTDNGCCHEDSECDCQSQGWSINGMQSDTYGPDNEPKEVLREKAGAALGMSYNYTKFICSEAYEYTKVYNESTTNQIFDRVGYGASQLQGDENLLRPPDQFIVNMNGAVNLLNDVKDRIETVRLAVRAYFWLAIALDSSVGPRIDAKFGKITEMIIGIRDEFDHYRSELQSNDGKFPIEMLPDAAGLADVSDGMITASELQEAEEKARIAYQDRFKFWNTNPNSTITIPTGSLPPNMSGQETLQTTKDVMRGEHQPAIQSIDDFDDFYDLRTPTPLQ